jgi:hypothetical protein
MEPFKIDINLLQKELNDAKVKYREMYGNAWHESCNKPHSLMVAESNLACVKKRYENRVTQLPQLTWIPETQRSIPQNSMN